MKLQNFFNSLIYFIILSGITFYLWMNQLDMIGVLLFSSMAFLVLALRKNSIHVIPILFNTLFLFNRLDWAIDTIPLYYYLIPISTFLGFFIHILRFREKWVHSHLFFPFLLLLIGAILSIFNIEVFDNFYLFYVAFAFFYFILYILFTQTIKGNQMEYLLKLFLVLGVLVSAEVLYHYIQTGDIAAALREDRVNLGWGLSNYVATYLIIFITASIYYLKTKPLKIITSLVLAFEILMLLFTLSRGGVLAFVFMIPLILIYLYHGQESKFRFTMYLLITFLSLVIVFVFQNDFFIPLFDRFRELDFTDGNGRVDLWIQAYHKFREHPIIGAGILARFDAGKYQFYHNTMMHTLASFGLIGLVSIIWQAIEVCLLFLRKMNIKKTALFLALLGANIHGMVDNVYYQLQFMVIFFVIFAVVESADNQQKKTKIWRLEYASNYEV